MFTQDHVATDIMIDTRQSSTWDWNAISERATVADHELVRTHIV